MGSRVKATLSHKCVNCNIGLTRMRRYPALGLGPRVTGILCSWVYPKIILEEDNVCVACRELAITAVNNHLHAEDLGNEVPGPSTKGHGNVCVLCGYSILRRKSNKILIDNPSELQQSIFNIIESRVAHGKISSIDRVCHPCWLRIKREAIRISRHDEFRPQLEVSNESQQEISNAVEQEHNVPQPKKSQCITIPDYRRAANTAHNCVFPNCNSRQLHRISDKLRAIVLHNHNYYLPKLTRVCDEHLSNNTWESLYHSKNSIQTFTAEHIQHVFSFINASTPSHDFDNIEEMDEKVFQYWLGLSKNDFNILLQELPRISGMRRGKLGLAALLLKMRTGDANGKISSLVEVPRRTLETAMKNVREILSTDFVPRHLGINNLSSD